MASATKGNHNAQAISESLALIFAGIGQLSKEFPHRRFTIDGRLVGDIGEVIAEIQYDILLHATSIPDYDGNTSDGRRVQIKATFKDQLTFKSTPDFYLGFKLFPDGRFKEIFNGPGKVIFDRYRHRRGIGSKLLSFPISELRELSRKVARKDRIPKRSQIVQPT